MSINYHATLMRVFEERDTSGATSYGFRAEIKITAPEPSSAGVLFHYTMRFPITKTCFGELGRKLRDAGCPVPVDVNIS
ncbi:MAG: hypothetical protein AABY16_00660 [Nanoarchaeota archaeon]